MCMELRLYLSGGHKERTIFGQEQLQEAMQHLQALLGPAHAWFQ